MPTGGPVVDDAISLWLLPSSAVVYRTFRRSSDCFLLFVPKQICGRFRGRRDNFIDPENIIKYYQLVRSWANFGLVEGARKLMTGSLRHAGTTDMPVSRLSDAERCSRPWNQLVKFGLEDTLARCEQALNRDSDRSVGVSIDEY